MKILFVILAILLLMLYSPYLLGIFQGRADRFEVRLQKEMAAMLEQIATNPFRALLPIVSIGLIFEAGYFFSAWMAVLYHSYRLLTISFILFETYHLIRTAGSVINFVKGQCLIDEVISWRMERMSALFLSFHALLGLLLL